MASQRYTIAIVDVRGVERRTTVSRFGLVVIAIALTLPALLGLGLTWKASLDAHRVNARSRSLDIEIANYRAATQALARQQTELGQPVLSPALAVMKATETPLIAQSNTERQVPAPVLPARTPLETQVVLPVAVRPPAESGSPAIVEPAERSPLTDALAKLAQARKSAEAANAQILASQSYHAGIALELETQQLASRGRTADALLRAVAAEASLRVSEIAARAETARRERGRPGEQEQVARSASEQPLDSPRRDPPSPVQAPASPARAEGPSDLPDDEQRIRRVIAQYVNGLEGRNLAALKQVWPTLGGIQEQALRTEFQNARTVHALFDSPRITISDDTTTVTGLRSYSLVTRDGQKLSSVTRTTITLRRTGDAWLIDQIVHTQ